MTDSFKQTVNLREKMEGSRNRSEEKKSALSASGRINTDKEKTPPLKKIESRAREIDRVFSENDEKEERKNMRIIDRPETDKSFDIYKTISFLLVLAVILFGAYYFFIVKNNEKNNEDTQESLWYSVKLTNDEVYYGQIMDIKADPVTMKNVYYNYDQIEAPGEGDKPSEAGGNLRLVKRGKETHGPDGTMDIVRSQILYMEPLREDSKVLKAILGNEK